MTFIPGKKLLIWSTNQVVPNLTGAYCVGNGRAFGLVGLSSPLWNWSNIYGDSYQEPTLGDMRMTVTRAGVDAKLTQQQIGWVKRSGVVKVKAVGAGLTVESYDFAPVSPIGGQCLEQPSGIGPSSPYRERGRSDREPILISP